MCSDRLVGETASATRTSSARGLETDPPALHLVVPFRPKVIPVIVVWRRFRNFVKLYFGEGWVGAILMERQWKSPYRLRSARSCCCFGILGSLRVASASRSSFIRHRSRIKISNLYIHSMRIVCVCVGKYYRRHKFIFP